MAGNVRRFASRNRRWLLAGTTAVGIAGALTVAVYWLATAERFAIDTVEAPERRWLPEDRLHARLEIDPPVNLFRYDTAAAVNRLEESPWVKSATIRRKFPSGLVIELVENEPAAIASIDELYLVDSAGVPFKRATVLEAAALELVVITGITRTTLQADESQTQTTISRAVDLARDWSSVETRPRLAEVNIDPVRGFTLIPATGHPVIRLGHGDAGELQKREALFDRAWAALDDSERQSAQLLHLDTAPAPSRVAISFAPKRPETEEKQQTWAN